VNPIPPIDPAGRAVMDQEWRHLLFAHRSVPAEALQALLPDGLEVNTFEARASVGLVPFAMRGIRPRRLPSLPGLSTFHETNVRTDVRREGRDPGVWFFSLDAASPVAVAGSRFGLPYHHARMSVAVDARGGAWPTLTYASRRLRPGPLPAVSRVRARAIGPAAAAGPGSIDHFLAERYRLDSARGGRPWRGQVRHAAYPLQPAAIESLDETLVAAAGIDRPDVAPIVHDAAGVRVVVFGLVPV